MDFIPDIIEMVLELILELGTDKSIPKWLRYPMLGIIVILTVAILISLFILGITLMKTNTILGVIILILGVILTVCSIAKLKSTIKTKKNNK